jgi:hypothetical protein
LRRKHRSQRSTALRAAAEAASAAVVIVADAVALGALPSFRQSAELL